MPEQPKQPSESMNPDQISQGEMIALLQKTIGQLEVIVNKLSTESIDNLPPRMVVETLTSNTEVLAELFDSTPTETVTGVGQPQTVNVSETLSDIPQEILFNEEEIDLEEPTEPVRVTQVPSTAKKPTKSSGGLLGSIVPSGLRDKLPTWAIIAVLTTVVVAVVSVSVVLVSRPSSQIAQTPISSTPSTSPEISTPTPTPSVTPEVIETPSEIEAPGNPEPVDFAPPPKPELTPEQSLIAAIQEQVSDLTSKYPEGLIATIEANFLGSRLIVTMGSQWYSLTPSRQDSLANAIFERSRRLDFRKLELIDQDGVAIARSPVVGDNMVILQRQKIVNPTS